VPDRSLILLFIVAFIGCYTPVDIELPEHEEKLLFFADLMPDGLVKASLTKSRVLTAVPGSLEAEFLKDADIKIFHGGQPVAELNYFSPAESGDANPVFSNTNFTVDFEKTYELTINLEGFDQVTAQCVIPRPVVITDVHIERIDSVMISPQDKDKYRIDLVGSLEIEDDFETANFYHLTEADVYYSWIEELNPDSTVADTLIVQVPLMSIGEDESAFISLINYPGFLVDDQLLESMTSIPFSLSFEWIKDENNIVLIEIKVRHCDKAYFDFYHSWTRHIESANSSFGQPVPVRSNLNEGIGYFSGYSTSKAVLQL